MLAGILGGFALVSFCLAGGTSSEAVLVLGVGFMVALLLGHWVLVKLQWKRLAKEKGGRGRAP